MKKRDLLKLSDKELDLKVKIQGTKYDRKRKITEKTIDKMCRMANMGNSYSQIAEKLGISYVGVRYNLDPIWRYEFNKRRNGAHTGIDHISPENRVEYKRMLVKKGKISV